MSTSHPTQPLAVQTSDAARSDAQASTIAPLRSADPVIAAPAIVAALLTPVAAADTATVERPARDSDVALYGDAPRGRVLFVASTGGHLTELDRLAARWSAADDSLWVTFDTPQSRTLLEGRRVRFVPYVAPRDLVGVVRATARIGRILREQAFDEVVSTGAAVAVGAFIAARWLGVRTLYVESVARVTGPSLTGRIIAGLRLAATRTQHAGWSSRRWEREGSVLAAFERVPRPMPATGPLRVFVTLGTIQPYRFDALVDAVLATGHAGPGTTWQLGSTTRDDLPGRAVALMGHDEFLRAALEADVVVTHAGVGTVLELLEAGVHPIVVARSGARREHVDEHQSEIARYIDSTGIATVVSPSELTAAALEAAAALATAAR